mgnify:CR=1 FL=1
MGDEKELDLSLFEQLDEALEERAGGSDRRKKNIGADDSIGEDRRKGDRRLIDDQ